MEGDGVLRGPDNAQVYAEFRRSAEEQAALRRVATLVARAAPPEQIFAAVTEEAGRLVAADVAALSRYTTDGSIAVTAIWDSGGIPPVIAGARIPYAGRNITSLVFETGRCVRIDGYTDTRGPISDTAREASVRASVGAPVSVAGQLWGAMIVSSRSRPLPADTEARLAGFTELAATAIANEQARAELHGVAEEQAALRRVAMLVARGAGPDLVFAAVTEEAGRLLGADLTGLTRYDADGVTTVVGTWARAGPGVPAVGTRVNPSEPSVSGLVFRTGRPARIDDYDDVTGETADIVQKAGIRCVIGAPITVADRLWGLVAVMSRDAPLPADTEVRLGGFCELAATAIANSEAQAALAASRQELRDLCQGVHPAILAEAGLGAAVRALARRSPLPVRVQIQADGRLPVSREVTAYYVAAEAFTNAAKHARASAVDILIEEADGTLTVQIRDDGIGGAAAAGGGSGRAGPRGRGEAVGGSMTLESPAGAGTILTVLLPVTADDH